MARIQIARTGVRRLLAVGCIVVAAIGAGRLAAEEALRTWTDATGKFKVTAKIVGFDGQTVRLEKQDKAPVALPLAKLSPADQEYVRAYDASNPFRPKNPFESAAPANPFTPTTPAPAAPAPGEMADAAGGPAAGEAAVDLVPVDWDSVPLLVLGVDSSPLSVQIEPVPGPERARTRPIELPPKIDSSESDGDILFDPASSTALFRSAIDRHRDAPTQALWHIDLSTGALSKPAYLQRFGAYAWDGLRQRVLVSQLDETFGPETLKTTVEVWKVDPKSFKPIFVALPYGDENRFRKRIVWGEFLFGDRFATVDGERRLAIWSLSQRGPLASCVLPFDASAAVSDDRRVLAVGTSKMVHFIDTTTLQTVGGIGGLTGAPKALDFSPDGKRFAIAGAEGGVWSLENNEKILDVDSGRAEGPGQFYFADNDSLYVFGKALDVESGTRLMEIKNPSKVSFACGGRMWMLAGRFGREKPRSLVIAQPRPGRTEERLSTIEAAERRYHLPADVPIRFDFEDLPADVRADAELALLEGAAAAGHPIDGTSEYAFVPTIETPEKEREIVLIKYELVVPPPLPPGASPFGPIGVPPGFPQPGAPAGFPGAPPVGLRGGGFGGVPGAEPAAPAAPPPKAEDLDPNAYYPVAHGVFEDMYRRMGQPYRRPIERAVAKVKPVTHKLTLYFEGKPVWDKSNSAIGESKGPYDLPLSKTYDEYVREIETGSAGVFKNRLTVPRSLAVPGVWQHPASGYYELQMTGLKRVETE